MSNSVLFQAVSGQTQQLKLIQQGTSQPTNNVSVNIGGQNVSLGQLSLQNLQFVQGSSTVSTATVQPDLATSMSQQQVTLQQGQGHDPVASQQRQPMTSQNHANSQQNILASVQQQTNLVSNTNQNPTSAPNPTNIAAQNYRGLTNMQQLMQKLQGNKVTVQSVTSSTLQTPVSNAQPVVAKVTTVAPNMNIFQIKREKIDSSTSNESSNVSSGPQTVKSLMLNKQAATLGTAKIIVKQEPVVKVEPSSVVNACNLVSHSSVQPASNIEGLLSTSAAFTTAHVTTVTNTISQSSTSLSNNFVSNSILQTVPSVDIKPLTSQSSSVHHSSGLPFVIPSQSNFSLTQNSSSSIVSALNSSNIGSSMTNTTNSLSGNLNSISPQETTSSVHNNSSNKGASGATLQTIHLPPELQQNFQRVQAKIREVNMMKNITSVERQNKLQQLNMIQRKILLKGRVLATTRAEPHHIQRGLEVLTSSGAQSDNTSQNSMGVSQSMSAQHSQPSTHQELQASQQSISPGEQSQTSAHQGVSLAQQSASSEQHFLTSVQQSLSSGQQMSMAQSTITSSQATSLDQFSFMGQNQSRISSSGLYFQHIKPFQILQLSFF